MFEVEFVDALRDRLLGVKLPPQLRLRRNHVGECEGEGEGECKGQ